jgi:hypothetical protein
LRELVLGLDSLGDHVQLHTVGHLDDGAHDTGVGRVGGDVADDMSGRSSAN